MKIVEADGFRFCFGDALEAFIFDEKDGAKITYHDAPMKCVDIIAEFEEVYVFVELKDYDDSSFFGSFDSGTDDEKTRHARLNTLKNYLKYKFRDSYLFRHAEQKVDKPIRYICLITFENALNSRIQKSLKRELPVGKASHRWVRELAISCHVVNLNRWNKNFPNWPVSRIPAPT